FLTCQFEAAPRSVGVLASVASDNGRPIDQDTFGWRVLGALTDQLTTWITPGHRAPYDVHIRMAATADSN
ncbi:MAG TPA: hypothetical protein VHW44_20500, partial [Pseudonocardiaceae bacterium]|nr:hypothetical protein [Pseudonocardiaceae bacterium]